MKHPNKACSARHVFAANVRSARQALGLSQEELADLAQLHRTYLSSVERSERNISIDNMEKIATALGTTISELIKEK